MIEQTVPPLMAFLISAIVILFIRGVVEELLRNDTFRVKMLTPAIETIIAVIAIVTISMIYCKSIDTRRLWGVVSG